MALSTLVALAGIGVATVFFLRAPERADGAGRRGSAASIGCCSNKYYVDEIYDARDRAADQTHVDRRCCGAAWMPA